MQMLRLCFREANNNVQREYDFLEYNPNTIEFFVVNVIRNGDDYSETKKSLDMFREQTSDSDKKLLSDVINEVFRP